MNISVLPLNIPDYVGQGLMELFVLTVGGLLVGWITHTYFARKAAIAEVEGEVMKTRLGIYEDLYKRLNMLLLQEVLPAGRTDAAFSAIQRAGMFVQRYPEAPTLTVMNSAKSFTDTYLELDDFINGHRLYYETDVDMTVLRFANYFAIFRRLQVMFEEQIVDEDIPLDDESVVRYENLMMTEISLLYQNELAGEVAKVHSALKTVINAQSRHRRKPQNHSQAIFGNDGEIIKYLSDLEIFRQRDKMRLLVSENVAFAIAAYSQGKRK